MDINYGWVALALVLAVALIIFLMVRNRKDRQTFEQDESEAGIPPRVHDDNEKV